MQQNKNSKTILSLTLFPLTLIALLLTQKKAAAEQTYTWQDLGNNGTRPMTGVVKISDTALARGTVSDNDIRTNDLFLDFQMPYQNGRLQQCSSANGDDLRGVNIAIDPDTGHLSGRFSCGSASTHLTFNFNTATNEWSWSRGTDNGRGRLTVMAAEQTYTWQDLGNNGTRPMTGVVKISDTALARGTVSDNDIRTNDLFLDFQMPYQNGRLQQCSSANGDDLRGVNIAIDPDTGHLSGRFSCGSASTHLTFNFNTATNEWSWSRGTDNGRGRLTVKSP